MKDVIDQMKHRRDSARTSALAIRDSRKASKEMGYRGTGGAGERYQDGVADGLDLAIAILEAKAANPE